MANNGAPDYTDKWLVNQKFLSPSSTDIELGAKIGLSGKAVNKRLNKPSVIALANKLQTDMFAQAIAIRAKAMENVAAYIKNPESKEGFEMTKLFVQSIADNPATLPEAEIEPPSFYDPRDKGDE